jgi:hypothetical protein
MGKALSPTVDKICAQCFNGLPEKERNRVERKDTKLKTFIILHEVYPRTMQFQIVIWREMFPYLGLHACVKRKSVKK